MSNQKYLVSNVYHDGDLQLEINLGVFSVKNKKEAEKIANKKEYFLAHWFADRIIIGGEKEEIIICKKDLEQYQFQVCHNPNKKAIVTSGDFKNVMWDEAFYFVTETYSMGMKVPFTLECYAYSVQEVHEVK